MPKIHVAVAGARKPKRGATREALQILRPALDSSAEFEVASAGVSGGLRRTPLSRGETMVGARSRAEALSAIALERNEPWRYFVCNEEGLNPIELDGVQHAFLNSWAFLDDRTGRSARGYSPGIPRARGVNVRSSKRRLSAASL